ncbi:nucleotide sugar dehydrogenase [Candidatus Woesearchaeota archaeon]|nr:nucleotide sugar dehydrogenase [Candidatus Woesearchaeota archaeon]RLE42905.1 MAG: nucleotide sugar dehydrogenase [Candidatus Woesearchaeota archaeon]
MKIAVVGLGKAGLPLAAVIADSGLEVIGVDISKERVAKINKGINPIPEEQELGVLLKKHAGSNLKATTDYNDAKQCDAFIVIVPLLIDDAKKPDFAILKQAFLAVAEVMKPKSLVVLETTVPPGTTETKVKQWLDSSGKPYYLAYSPERIMTGYSISRYREFPKVVAGIDAESGRLALELYKRFCNAVHLVSSIRTAELIKVAEGVYRDVNIALANELYKVSNELGVDFYEVRKYANHRYCHIHKPGNVGGHCIPIYPWFLINQHNVPLIKLARELNDEMLNFYAKRLQQIVPKGGKVLVVGLSFREGVKEVAYSRSIPLIAMLKQQGYEVYVYDPLFTEEEIRGLGFKYSKDFSSMDGIIVMNYYPELRDGLMLYKDKVVDVKGVFNDFAVD